MVVESDVEGDETMEKTNETDSIPKSSQMNNSDQLPQMHQSDKIVQTNQMDFMHREVQTDYSVITRDQATQTEQNQQDIQNALNDLNDSLETAPNSLNSFIASGGSQSESTAIENNREKWNNDHHFYYSQEAMKSFNDGKLNIVLVELYRFFWPILNKNFVFQEVQIVYVWQMRIQTNLSQTMQSWIIHSKRVH